MWLYRSAFFRLRSEPDSQIASPERRPGALKQRRGKYFQSRSRLRNPPTPKPLDRRNPSFCPEGMRPHPLVVTLRCLPECPPSIVVVLCLWRRSLRWTKPTPPQSSVEHSELQPSPEPRIQTQSSFLVSCSSFRGLNRHDPTGPAAFPGRRPIALRR